MAGTAPPVVPRTAPRYCLLLDTNDPFADFEASEVDVALRYGVPNWERLYHEQIVNEELIVVAAPALVGNSELPMNAEETSKLPLSYDAFNVGWESWAERVGLKADQVNSENTKYVDSAVLIEVAVDRQGVASTRHLLAARDLELGRLVGLDQSSIQLERGLHFVCRQRDQERVSVRTFKKWLQTI